MSLLEEQSCNLTRGQFLYKVTVFAKPARGSLSFKNPFQNLESTLPRLSGNEL